jgi:hypothetical protein
VTITVRATTPGTATNTASVSGGLTDPNPANNSASVGVTINPAPPPPPPPPRKTLSLRVSPAVVLAHTRRCFAFRATSNGIGVGGVTVKFAGKKAHTSTGGKARLCVTLKHRGNYRASASKAGYPTAHVFVHVKPTPKKKPIRFTG